MNASNPIEELLDKSSWGARVAFFGRPCGSWSLSAPVPGSAGFHIVASGSCVANAAGWRSPRMLGALDLVIFKPRAVHEVKSAYYVPDSRPLSVEPIGSAAAPTALICGAIDWHLETRNLFSGLPACIVLPCRSGEAESRQRLVDCLVRELAVQDMAWRPVSDRLCDLLLAFGMRDLYREDASELRWARARAHPAIRRALDLIHRQPAHAWRLSGLASIAGMSRTRFAATFAELVGRPPMRYLRDYRLGIARRELELGRADPARMERLCGYRNWRALRRALRRESSGSHERPDTSPRE